MVQFFTHMGTHTVLPNSRRCSSVPGNNYVDNYKMKRFWWFYDQINDTSLERNSSKSMVDGNG